MITWALVGISIFVAVIAAALARMLRQPRFNPVDLEFDIRAVKAVL